MICFICWTALSKRTITGHDIIQYTKGYIAVWRDYKDLVFCILDKNLKTRTGVDLINKAIPKCCPNFQGSLTTLMINKRVKLILINKLGSPPKS